MIQWKGARLRRKLTKMFEAKVLRPSWYIYWYRFLVRAFVESVWQRIDPKGGLIKNKQATTSTDAECGTPDCPPPLRRRCRLPAVRRNVIVKAVIAFAILFVLFYIIRHSSVIKEIFKTVDINAIRGYFHCSIDKAQFATFDKDYPCDFSPQPNPSDVTIVTFINSAWVPLWKNWIRSAEQAGLKDNLFLVGFEPNVCTHVTGIPCYEHPGINIGMTSFAQPGYQKMMLERTRIILKLLSCGRKVALVDADITFLKNPLPYLDKTMGDKDIVFQADSSGVAILDSIIPYLFNYVCGGFIYMRSNDPVKQLWLSVLQYQSNFQWSDQAGLNICIRHHSQNVRWGILDSEYFPNGRQYFYYNQTSDNNLIVHANHLIGNSNKLVRMIAADLWFEVDHGKDICSHPPNFHSYCTPKKGKAIPEWCPKFVQVCRTKFGVQVQV